MGYGTTRSLERMAAAMGGLGPAPIVFEPARDIPQGGVLLALPALLAVGLLRHSLELYQLPPGFYGLSSVFLLLALMALARIPSLEQLRYVSAGEWGNLLGLDRIPEVRTLRQKLKLLCAEAGRAARWNAALAREWIREAQQRQPQGVAFYVDGHVRVYHGKLTKLPRHYVARQRFYLPATVDYWINALDGQPFFYINKEVDHGLVQALRDDVLPWLKANAPISKDQQRRLAADPRLPRFTLIFDREGYSPDLFAKLHKERIAALSYPLPGAGLAARGIPAAGGEAGERPDGAHEAGRTRHAARQKVPGVGAGGAQAGRTAAADLDGEHESDRECGLASGGPAGALVSGKLLQIHAGTLWFRRLSRIRDRRDS